MRDQSRNFCDFSRIGNAICKLDRQGWHHRTLCTLSGSDQYTSLAFGQRCEQAGVRPSMGSVGDCFDNAMCESFFATLECELLERCRFKTQLEARWRYSISSKVGITRAAVILPWAIYRRLNTNAFIKTRQSRTCGARPLCAPRGRRQGRRLARCRAPQSRIQTP